MKLKVESTLKELPKDRTLANEQDAKKQKAHMNAPTLKELKEAPSDQDE